MKVIPPVTIGDSELVSSTLTEPAAGSPSTESVWSAAATYALGDEAISTTQHRKYESLQAANLNKPLPVLPETETDWWLDIGPTNKWAMFDLYRNTQSSGASPITVKIAAGERVNSVGLLGLDATSVTISLDSAVGSPSINYYYHTEDLSTRDVDNWYEYYYSPFLHKTNVLRFDVPPYAPPSILTITVTNTAGTSSVGGVVVGSAQYLGETQRDADFQFLSFSLIERDAFGNANLVPRRAIPTTDQTILLDKEMVPGAAQTIRDLDAVPALWSSLDEDGDALFEPMLILGIYRDARFILGTPDCQLRLRVEEI